MSLVLIFDMEGRKQSSKLLSCLFISGCRYLSVAADESCRKEKLHSHGLKSGEILIRSLKTTRYRLNASMLFTCNYLYCCESSRLLTAIGTCSSAVLDL